MCAAMLYLCDNLGVPDIKHELESGTPIEMNKTTQDNDPKNTKIGDKQYHHFTINFDEPANDVSINVSGGEGYDFHVFAALDTFAFKNNAEFGDSTAGNNKVLDIGKIKDPCTLYIGVKLNTTVTTTSGGIFPQYGGSTDVLNGIAYSVEAMWKAVGIVAENKYKIQSQFNINVVNMNTVNVKVGDLKAKSLQIFDTKGRLCWSPRLSDKVQLYSWHPTSAGMYIVYLKYGNGNIYTKPLTIVK